MLITVTSIAVTAELKVLVLVLVQEAPWGLGPQACLREVVLAMAVLPVVFREPQELKVILGER